MPSKPADHQPAHSPKSHIHRRRRNDKGTALSNRSPQTNRAAPATHLAALHHLLVPSHTPTQHSVFHALAPTVLSTIVLCCIYLTLRTHLVPAPTIPPELAKMGVTGVSVTTQSRSPILDAAMRAEDVWRRWTEGRGWRGAASVTAGLCAAAVAALRVLIWVVATMLREDKSREVVVRGGDGEKDHVVTDGSLLAGVFMRG